GNAGQTCAGVERLYVVDSVYDEFGRLVAEKSKVLHPGPRAAAYGPMTMAGQSDLVRGHVQDALDKGGSSVVGGLD
ncbi:aldehyde dehydrogenase family protein, partial [Rhodococcus sp. IEGM 1307]|uniref:aldehyde dehydrogenase family protein n=1 Tax=Rhodococcus sp. IEGM 1307 TaxID=3047091 RepID=UPI0024B67166